MHNARFMQLPLVEHFYLNKSRWPKNEEEKKVSE